MSVDSRIFELALDAYGRAISWHNRAREQAALAGVAELERVKAQNSRDEEMGVVEQLGVSIDDIINKRKEKWPIAATPDLSEFSPRRQR